MSVEQTQRTLDRYFGLMGRGEDFAVCFTADVTWLVADTGVVIQGPEPVREYINDLHSRMVGTENRVSAVGGNYVYLEGACAATAPDSGRVNYCIAYDMRDDLIAAVRCYGLGTV